MRTGEKQEMAQIFLQGQKNREEGGSRAIRTEACGASTARGVGQLKGKKSGCKAQCDLPEVT